MKKRLLKHPLFQSLAAWLFSLYIRLVFLTSRIEQHVDETALPYLHGERNGIFAFWHGRMMLLPVFQPPGRKMHVLISHHRDGRLIARVIAHFGQRTISGSSNRGGIAAAREIMQALKAGDNISITPDGPRGPFQQAAAGIVRLAAMTDYPIVPVAYSAAKHKRLSSWDRFMVARPFSRVAFFVGAPIAHNDDVDIMRDTLERRLTAITQEADRAC